MQKRNRSHHDSVVNNNLLDWLEGFDGRGLPPAAALAAHASHAILPVRHQQVSKSAARIVATATRAGLWVLRTRTLCASCGLSRGIWFAIQLRSLKACTYSSADRRLYVNSCLFCVSVNTLAAVLDGHNTTAAAAAAAAVLFVCCLLAIFRYQPQSGCLEGLPAKHLVYGPMARAKLLVSAGVGCVSYASAACPCRCCCPSPCWWPGADSTWERLGPTSQS